MITLMCPKRIIGMGTAREVRHLVELRKASWIVRMVEKNRPQRERGLFNRTRHRSALLIVGMGALALGLGISTGCAKDSDEATDARPATTTHGGVVHLTAEALARAGLEVRPVVRGEFRLHTDLPATVQPNENQLAEVTTLIRGRIVDVYVDVGQDVKTGAVLARLHSSELGLAQASYLKAQAKLHEAELAFDRARGLLEGRAISVAQLQRYEAEAKTARAEAREARDRLEVFGMSEADLQRLDRDRTIHSYVPIRSPLGGRVIARNVTKGEVVETSHKLFTVADLSEVWVVANVPEKDVRLIHRDQSVEIRLSAYPNEIFPGRLTYIGDVLDPATRMMKIRVTTSNLGRRLKPEMFATVRAYSPPEPNALTVPVAAVQRDGKRTLVFVQHEAQRFEARPVKLGDESGEVVKVLDGLREGEQVVIKGAFLLKSELAKKEIEPTR